MVQRMKLEVTLLCKAWLCMCTQPGIAANTICPTLSEPNTHTSSECYLGNTFFCFWLFSQQNRAGKLVRCHTGSQITVPNQTRRGLMCWSKFRFNVTTWLILHQRSVAARPYLCKCVSFVSKLSHPLSFLISDVEMADKRVLFFFPFKCCYVTLFHQATLKTKKKIHYQCGFYVQQVQNTTRINKVTVKRSLYT